MRFHTLLVAALAITTPSASIPTTEAFTYGPYLPSYICGPAIANADGTIVGKDGTPKALAGVLKQFVEKTPASGDPYIGQQQDSRGLVAAFHNANANGATTLFGDPANAANLHPLSITTNVINNTQNITNGAIPIVAQVNILNVGRIQALPTPAAADVAAGLDASMVIVPGGGITAVTTTLNTNQVVTLTLQAQNNVLGQPSGAVLNADQFGASGTQPVLDGAVLYVQDANNNRVGKFVATGPSMVVWPACGADSQGIVHNQLLSDTNTYNGPQFFLPWSFFAPVQKAAPAPQTINFMGAAVSDNGFGYHQTKWTVTPQTLALDLNALNKGDVVKCAQTSLPCFAACVDCAQKGGSTKNQAAKTANLACTPTTTFGTTKVNPQTQQTIWTATCTINKAATSVAPAGAIVIPPPKAAGAVDNATTNADAIALNDILSQLILTTNNGTAMDMDAMNNAATTTTGTTCPAATTSTNSVNSAISSSTVSLFSSLVVAVGALFARQ